MNILIDGKFRLVSDGHGYTLKEITGVRPDTGGEATTIRGHFMTLAYVPVWLAKWGHKGTDVDTIEKLAAQIAEIGRQFEALQTAPSEFD